PIPGERIHGARGITNQSDAAAHDGWQSPQCGHVAPLESSDRRSMKLRCHRRKLREGAIQAELRILRKHDNTDLRGARGRDDDLAAVTPMHLHAVRPGSCLKVSAEPEA